jgi:outer membrane protein assembly factor BamB
VPSPLLYDGWLYYLRHYQGVLSRVNAKTGNEPSGPFRLGSVFNIYSSPVAAAGRIYVTDRNGKTLVISNDAEPKALTLNKLDDRFSASAALVGDAIFLRGEKFLYCIGEKD